ncbi:hypothetical protein L7F22_032718 [Adiantum nelumboides]|nr:hypothetical protein [Adiantum nelumboides]
MKRESEELRALQEARAQVWCSNCNTENTSDSLGFMRRELEALKLQRALQEERSNMQTFWLERNLQIQAFAHMKRESKELRALQEARAQVWRSNCNTADHPNHDCPQRASCTFCAKSGHEDKDCYYLKGLTDSWNGSIPRAREPTYVGTDTERPLLRSFTPTAVQVQAREPVAGKGAKVVAVSLNKVYKLHAKGISFRFLPDPEQVKNALQVTVLILIGSFCFY